MVSEQLPHYAPAKRRKEMEKKSIFMRIKIKGHKPDAEGSKTRVFVMEIPSGKLYEGLLATDFVKGLKLRQCIHVDLEDCCPASAEEVFNPRSFDLQPEAAFSVGSSE
jgi:hypothetical protein